MAQPPRLLTKTLFLTALDCPTKLYYAGKPAYASTKQDDPFLEALADGGFQVGKLAQLHYPDGILVEATQDRLAAQQTARLMDRDPVTLFEPVFQIGTLSVRVDILVKKGDHLRLIEVKAKSVDDPAGACLRTKAGDLASGWLPYLCDAAFQTHVLSKALPGARVEPFLMMVDKSARCATDGLNQKLRIRRDRLGRPRVEVSDALTQADLAQPLLVEIPVAAQVEQILDGRAGGFAEGFSAQVECLAEACAADLKIPPEPGACCRKCEFRCSAEDQARGLRSGFAECWREAFGLTEPDLGTPSVLDIWSFRAADRYVRAGQWRMADAQPALSVARGDNAPGLSRPQRQRLQVDKTLAGDSSPYLDRDGLRAEMQTWVYPLHFIDFETAAPALPFTRGRRPYEGIAFQFSHHVVEDTGAVRHAGQFLQAEPGVFPNYQFARTLRDQLAGDDGTVFTYGTHESTFLKTIAEQIEQAEAPLADGPELLGFIRGLFRPVGDRPTRSPRAPRIQDMLRLVQRYYYAPATSGSCSLKRVLAATLSTSRTLQRKYGRPVYGSASGIPSCNYKDWQWVRREGERVADPYQLLPPLFEGLDLDESAAILSQSDELREGGAATTAWALTQFSDMTTTERQRLCRGLLRYCELDTLAMVMLYEAWVAMLNGG